MMPKDAVSSSSSSSPAHLAMNTHYLLAEARDHALAAAKLIDDLHNGPEDINRQDLDQAVQRLRLAIELLQDETVDFEIGETDD